jgi:predicted permease
MELAIVLGAIIVSLLVFTLLWKILRATVKTAILVALTLLVLQLVFGIGPQVIWQQIQDWLPGFERVE